MALFSAPTVERLAYDLDGSVGFMYDVASTTLTTLTATQLQQLNNEDPSNGVTVTPSNPPSDVYVGILFPVPKSISTNGVHVAVSVAALSTAYNNSAPQYSTNTTTGVDGGWNSLGTFAGPDVIATGSGTPNSLMRAANPSAGITSTSVKGVRARFTGLTSSGLLSALHLFGYDGSTTNDRLRFWHPTLNQDLTQNTPAALDFGDVARGTTYQTASFRVKNQSTTLTANAPVISTSALTDSTSPTQLSEIEFSIDSGATWGTSRTLSNIAPNTISGVVLMRRVKASNSAVGPWAQRVRAAATSWS